MTSSQYFAIFSTKERFFEIRNELVGISATRRIRIWIEIEEKKIYLNFDLAAP
jgi:hypothetical protein